MAGTSKDDITHPWSKGRPLTADGVVSALRTLGRKVMALPPRHFIPLNDALALAKSRLGSYSLAAHDLTRRAGAGEFTIGARMIRRDGSDEVFLLRRAAWQSHVIREHSYFEAPPGSELFARAHGPVFSSVFGWHFFVGRRRLERVYSTAAPTKSTPKKPPPDPEQWLAPMRAKFAQLPNGKKSAWVRDKAFPQMRRELEDRAPWHTWDSLKRAMQSGRRKKI